MSYAKPHMQMMPQGYPYAQNPNMYPGPLINGMQNGTISLQVAPMPVINFQSPHDIMKRKEEFKKLAKQNRQDILKGFLLNKLKSNKNPEL